MAGRLEAQLQELLDAREEELNPEPEDTFEPFLCANCGYYNEPEPAAEEKPKAKAHMMVASRNGGRSG